MDSENTTAPAPKKAGGDHRIKIIFLLAAVVGIVAVQFLQRSGQVLPDWDEDLQAALDQASQERRMVLVFFADHPPGEISRWLAGGTIRKNQEAIEEGNFLPVLVRLSSLDDTLAGRYKIQTLPAMLILDHRGRELNRREGKIGEGPFRDDFLNLRKIVKPPSQ